MSEPTQAHQTLGRYQLLVPIARGGMGQVWLARLKGARGFNKLVAIKTLLPSSGDLSRFEAMLAEEARLASLIHHANVAHTLELGEHEGMLYLVMEWVDGEPLGFLLDRADERGGMPLEVAVALLSQVLAGLHAAHELTDDAGLLGVVHRDVSPHNILVTYEGVAKLLDFGVAKATRQAGSTTALGEVKGKFSYMAPEQILGADVDRRCDVFAAGIVLYLLTTGRHPFKHHNVAAVIHAITTDDPVAPPSVVVEDYPPRLEQVLLKALEKEATQRWASAEEMRNALEQAVPAAFGDAGRAAVREFMERAVGDRKVARREAVRRAELAADSRDIETGARRAFQNGGSAQSASSLRAISISQPSPSDAPALSGDGAGRSERSARSEQSGRHTLPAPRKKANSKAPFIAAATGVVLALAVTLPRLFAPHGEAQPNSAATGVEAGAPLAVPAPSAPAAPAVDVPVQVLTPEAAATPAPSASIAPPVALETTLVAPRKAKRPSINAKKVTDENTPAELLSPAYAR